MGRKSKSELTPISMAIIDVCRDLLGNWGGKATDFFRQSGITQNYWYTRMRYELPFNTSDIDMIAKFFGTTSLDIYAAADRLLRAREQSRHIQESPIGDAMAQLEQKAGWKADYTTAAYRDPNKKAESETPDD